MEGEFELGMKCRWNFEMDRWTDGCGNRKPKAKDWRGCTECI